MRWGSVPRVNANWRRSIWPGMYCRKHCDPWHRRQLPGIIEAHGELSRLAGQATTYNFDPGLLVMEIGTLLASAAPPREPAHG